MASYTNEPFFATEAKRIIASDSINTSTFLGASALYVGATGNLSVITTGTVGDKGVTMISISANGSGYVTAVGLPVLSASTLGSGMTVDIVATAGVIDTVTVNSKGSSYKLADTLTIEQGGASGGAIQVEAIQSLPPITKAVTFDAVPAGTMLPVIVDYVISTGTTASAIIAYK